MAQRRIENELKYFTEFMKILRGRGGPFNITSLVYFLCLNLTFFIHDEFKTRNHAPSINYKSLSTTSIILQWNNVQNSESKFHKKA